MVRARDRAFTLPELLTVLAILLVLASLMFPVFRAVRESARKSACLAHFRQGSLAMTLYLADYDDRFMPASYQPGEQANSRTDRTWVQLLLPYMRSFGVFQCPSDYGRRPTLDATFDQDLVPGDTDSRYYTVSQRSDLGYNYLYLSPIVRSGSEPWMAATRLASTVSNPSNTIAFVDSVWARDENGVPFGGGNYLVVPPCRYVRNGVQRVDTFNINQSQNILYVPKKGWDVDNPNSALVYGGAWPWHNGRMNIGRLDGSVRAVSPQQLSAGCRVADDWGGDITSPSAYVWDFN